MPHKDPVVRKVWQKEYAKRHAVQKQIKATQHRRNRNPQRIAYAKDYHANRNQRVKYGITLDEQKQLLQMQGGRCAVPECGATEPGGRGGWCTEHDHETKKVRGVTCRRCNVVLGLLGDTAEAAARFGTSFVTYLRTGARLTAVRLAVLRMKFACGQPDKHPPVRW